MRGNPLVRFGKRDGETFLRKVMERFISTFTAAALRRSTKTELSRAVILSRAKD
jgi:hypothetical protein